MKELLEKRTLNSKTFRNDDGSFTIDAHTGYIHYSDKNTGKLEDIKNDLIETPTGWEMKKAGYEVEIPKKSNGILKFFANNEEIDFVHLKADGQSIKVVDGIQTDHHQITYPEILPNIDLKLSAGYNSFRKEIVIKTKPVFVGDFYEIEFQIGGSFNEKIKMKGFQEGRIRENKRYKFSRGGIAISQPRVWDNGIKSTDIELDFQAGRMIKKIPREFLEQATYPVITDTIQKFYPISSTLASAVSAEATTVPLTDATNFSASGNGVIDDTDAFSWTGKAGNNLTGCSGVLAHDAGKIVSQDAAGDGKVFSGYNASWDTVHDLTNGSTVDYTTNAMVVASSGKTGGGNFSIERGFIPIDTSALPNNASISAATLNLYVYGTFVGENDGDDWMNVVQTSQADTASLVTEDYDQCGAVNNPTEGATRLDVSSDIVINQYNVWTLNATGRGWISLTGTTLLGIREGHDAIDSPIAIADGDVYMQIRFSEYADTGSDPYLSVTYTTPSVVTTGFMTTNSKFW